LRTILTCAELVELVTDYFDEALADMSTVVRIWWR